MPLMTAREIAETHGIKYDRLRYLVRTKRIKATGDTTTCYGSIRSKLYDVKDVFAAIDTVDARTSNRAIDAHEYLIANPKKMKHPDTIDVEGRLFALKSWIMREKGFSRHQINHVLFYRDIYALKVQGGCTYEGTASYYDVKNIDDAKRIKRRPSAPKPVPEVATKKTAIEYRMEGRKLAWIARKLGIEIYDVMKQLEMA